MDIKEADWKHEKHVPVIDVSKEEDGYKIDVSVGKEIPHPNTFEHHIKWIEVYFLPEGSEQAFPVGRATFDAHGELGNLCEPRASFFLKTEKKGKLVALSFCNIHGLWKGEKEL